MSPDLLNLFSNIKPLLSRDTDIWKLCPEIVDSYVVLDCAQLFQFYGEFLVANDLRPPQRKDQDRRSAEIDAFGGTHVRDTAKQHTTAAIRALHPEGHGSGAQSRSVSDDNGHVIEHARQTGAVLLEDC